MYIYRDPLTLTSTDCHCHQTGLCVQPLSWYVKLILLMTVQTNKVCGRAVRRLTEILFLRGSILSVVSAGISSNLRTNDFLRQLQIAFPWYRWTTRNATLIMTFLSYRPVKM